METAEFIRTLRTEGPLLAEAARRAGLDAPVPTCPGWQVRDLLLHTGAVHRWAAGFVTEGRTRSTGMDQTGPGDEEPISWYLDLHRRLVEALAAAPAGLECWTFLPASSPLAFWARRQAHETTVHRADAEAAAGLEVAPVEAAFAADGVEELLLRFETKGRRTVRADRLRTLRVRTDDVAGDGWTLHFSPQPPRMERGGADTADCEVSGPAADLYLALWNRRPHDVLAVRGDDEVMDLWRRAGIG